MRIGFDVSQTGGGRAGCGMMSHHLIRALAELDGENEYLLYPAFGDLFWERDRRSIEVPAAANFRKVLEFRSFEASRRFWTAPPADFEARLGDPDVVQSNNFFCPSGLKKARLVYFLHDIAFLEDPNFSTPENRTGCFRGVYEAALRADMIVANSAFTREHFLKTFPHYPAERARVMHLASRFGGAGPGIRPALAAGLEAGGYFLCVGTIEPRKNHARLFEAYARFVGETGSDAPLVLAGGKGWLVDDAAALAERLGIGSRLVLTGYLDDEALIWLYRNCLGFAYPSLFEGFGLPVVEALSLGAPVITSSVSSLPEVAGDAALLVDPLDVAGLSEAMARLWREPTLRAALAAKAAARAGFFSWDKAARSVMEYHQNVAALPKYSSR